MYQGITMTYHDDYWSDYDNESIDFRTKQEKSEDALRKTDPYYDSYYIKINRLDKDGEPVKQDWLIRNYGSGLHGTYARNAVDGSEYNIIVGSAKEDLLFKVIDSSSRNKRREPIMLYYNSPEQYERHHFTEVDHSVKQKWNERNLNARLRYGEL